MKTKFSLLAFLLSSSLFAFETNPWYAPPTYKLVFSSKTVSNNSIECNNICGGMGGCGWFYVAARYISFRSSSNVQSGYQGFPSYCSYTATHYNFSVVDSCPVGTVAGSDGICKTTCTAPQVTNYDTGTCYTPISCPSGQHATPQNTCVVDSFPYFTGNPDGCRNFGGKYYSDGSCLSPNDFITKLYKDPNAKLYGGLLLGGAILSGGGWLAGMGGLIASTTGATVVTTGALSMGGGTYGLVASLDSTHKVSTDSGSAPSGSIRVDLKDYKLSTTPDAGGKLATKTNPTTGKVDSALFIPDSVSDQLNDSTNINPDTQDFITPIDTTGVQTITYNYDDGTATVVTNVTPTTITTKTTAITVSQNSDGSITTIPNSPIAPTVSGQNGGTVVPSNYSPASSGTTGAGTTGDGKDYTGVLNDIKTNTSQTAQYTKDTAGNTKIIAEAFGTGVFNGTAPSDGSENFGQFDTQIKGSFSGFVYTDPLGISNIGSGQNVPTYSFSLMGQTYVLFDQNLFNNLPLAVIKGILLFVAAVSGFLTVVSFGA